MEYIQKTKTNVAKLLDEQNFPPENPADFQISPIVKSVDAGDGSVLLFNGYTEELVVLSEEEYEDFQSMNFESETGQELFKHYFYVRKDFDAPKEVDSIRSILQMILPKPKGYEGFLILTTTDCNARCFYCYEKGCEKMVMSPETALKLVEFMDKIRNRERTLHLNFFGGEPLFNEEPIDIITSELEKRKIDFVSDMISNGYLFTEENVVKAKNLWKLKSVQITLDGTEEVYNKRKAYIYKEGSAYKKVLHNIDLLLDQEIKVMIRLNADRHNMEDLRNLRKELYGRFRNRKNLEIYIRMIYDERDRNYENPSSEEDIKRYQEFFDFEKDLETEGFFNHRKIGQFRYKTVGCMSDNGISLGFLPNGEFITCEHFNESPERFGTVFKGEIDEKSMGALKEVYSREESCKDCPALLRCIRLKRCPAQSEHCGKLERERWIVTLQEAMKNSYKNFLENKEKNESSEEEDDEKEVPI